MASTKLDQLLLNAFELQEALNLLAFITLLNALECSLNALECY